jgi:hypothetical protein
VIEFPDRERAEGWYASPAYQAILPHPGPVPGRPLTNWRWFHGRRMLGVPTDVDPTHGWATDQDGRII